MTHPCPLPVDWLDYLSGTGDDELATHLVGCRSCRALVASLEQEMVIPDDWSAAFAGRTDATWSEERPARAEQREFWFSAPSFTMTYHAADVASGDLITRTFSYEDVDRVLLLVVSHSDDDHINGWHDVVPVLSDIERASDTDLLIGVDHNTLGTSLRALFAHQYKVTRDQLDARVGTLTADGADLLNAALAGTVPDECWGIPLEGPDDERARLDDELEEALLRLRTPWALALGDPETVAGAPPTPAPDMPADPFGDYIATVLDFVPREWEDTADRALAAAATETPGDRVWELTAPNLHVVATLENDWDGNGDLLFRVRALQADARWSVRVVVYLHGSEHPIASEPFDLETGETVRIASPAGATTFAEEVDRLGAEVQGAH